MNTLATLSSFSVNSIEDAKKFYSEVLDCTFEDIMAGIQLSLPGGGKVWAYGKENHVPSTYTVLNFIVKDIDEAVKTLTAKGVSFERYPDMYQDDDGITRGKDYDMGPNIAWFKDPAGNVLSVLEE